MDEEKKEQEEKADKNMQELRVALIALRWIFFLKLQQFLM